MEGPGTSVVGNVEGLGVRNPGNGGTDNMDGLVEGAIVGNVGKIDGLVVGAGLNVRRAIGTGNCCCQCRFSFSARWIAGPAASVFFSNSWQAPLAHPIMIA